MYERVKLAIRSGEEKALIFEIAEEKPEDMVEVTSLLLDDIQFIPFLENFLSFSEEIEEYERCSEIKSLIEEYKREQYFKKW
jgi:hypothetical protein